MIDNILKEDISLEDLGNVIDAIVNDKDFVSSEIEIEFYDNIDELKDTTEYDSDKHNIIIVDDLNKEQLNYKRVQMLFKRARHSNLSVFVISHG